MAWLWELYEPVECVLLFAGFVFVILAAALWLVTC
jgi:hypothetical protein